MSQVPSNRKRPLPFAPLLLAALLTTGCFADRAFDDYCRTTGRCTADAGQLELEWPARFTRERVLDEVSSTVSYPIEPTLSHDGLRLCVSSGTTDVYCAEREGPDMPFRAAVLQPLGLTWPHYGPMPALSPDGTELWVVAQDSGKVSLQRATWDASAGVFTQPTRVERVSNLFSDIRDPAVATDGTLFFSSNEEGEVAIFSAQRFADGGVSSPVRLPMPGNASAVEPDSPDGRHLVFISDQDVDRLRGSRRVDGGWEQPVALTVDGKDEGFRSPELLPDGRLLYTSSQGIEIAVPAAP